MAAATYHQIWWPPHDEPVYLDGHLPRWDEQAGGYVDPGSGDPLPTWGEALDAIGEDDLPAHVVRFGTQVRADGITAGSGHVGRMIGYLTKYLTKSLDSCHEATTDAQRRHVDRLAEALRYEPCSPTCSNWLRFGVQPRNARPGLAPGRCRGKAHKRATLGFGGRRVLVSRCWSGKSLDDHRADRRAWVAARLASLGRNLPDPAGSVWMPARPGEAGVPRREYLIMRAIADRARWRSELAAYDPPSEEPGTRVVVGRMPGAVGEAA